MSETISRIGYAFATAMVFGLTACHGILDVSDPTHIDDADIANANGANARRLNASAYFSSSVLTPIREVALFTDEWTVDYPADQAAGILSSDRNALLDMRDGALLQALGGSDYHLGFLDLPVVQAAIAIPAVRAYTPDSLQGDFLAQLYAIRGYSILQMAEDLCPGFPVNDVVDNLAVYGKPLTTDSALGLAIGQLDSAIKYVRDSARFATLARVAKGRALLDRQMYTEAAAVVAPVLTNAVYLTEQNQRIAMANRWCDECENIGIANREGVNGLAFPSSSDPRVPVAFLGTRATNPNDTLWYTTKGRNTTDRVVLASGIEARLIQAEVALHDNSASWKPILDSLRATVGLAPLMDPGNVDGRINLLYQERAFWLYMTGRRLGDLRRLMNNYGRGAETVFPTGSYKGGSGGTYGTATSIPFILTDQQQHNPYVTTGCSGS